MIKKYLITIQQPSEPRYQQFFSQLPFNESEFTVIGVKGLSLSTKEYFELGVRNHKRPLSPSELGCTLSHKKALEDFLSTDAKYCYVLEDDVKVKDHFDFDTNLAFLGSGFVLSLGGVSLSLCRSVRGQLLSQKICNQPILKTHPEFYNKLFYTMGYVMDRKAAAEFVAYQQQPRVADHWKDFLNQYPDLHFYMTDLLDHPDIDEVTDINSSIQAERSEAVAPDKNTLIEGKHYSFFYFIQLWWRLKLTRWKTKLRKRTLSAYPYNK